MDDWPRGVKQRDQFIEAGLLTPEAVMEGLGISKSYARQLIRGSKPIRAPIQNKLDALIAAKANDPAPLSPLNKDEPDPVFAPVIERAEPMPSAQPENKNRRYMVVHMDLGNYALVEVLAPFRDAGTANLVCDLLNKEAG